MCHTNAYTYIHTYMHAQIVTHMLELSGAGDAMGGAEALDCDQHTYIHSYIHTRADRNSHVGAFWRGPRRGFFYTNIYTYTCIHVQIVTHMLELSGAGDATGGAEALDCDEICPFKIKHCVDLCTSLKTAIGNSAHYPCVAIKVCLCRFVCRMRMCALCVCVCVHVCIEIARIIRVLRLRYVCMRECFACIYRALPVC
jgi:hypothetical protein